MTRRSLLRIWLPAALTAAAVVVAAAIVLWRLTWMAPGWWSPLDPLDEQTAQLAERVEYRLAEQVHQVRPEPAPWWLEVRQDQINAWLATRLPAWVAHAHGVEWPAGVGLPQVSLGAGGVRLGLDVETDAGTRYVVAHVVPRIVDGELALTLESMSVGRLRIPGATLGTVADRLRGAGTGRVLDDPAVDALIAVLDGRRRLDPTLTLNDGRRVRVLELRCDSGAVLLRAETLAQE